MPNATRTFDKLDLAKGKIAEYRYYIRQSVHPAGAISTIKYCYSIPTHNFDP